jgi:GNAT superfamily N-acetyltransferase
VVIERCTPDDVAAIYTIVNDAAEAYRGVIPAEGWHEPYMPREELEAEIAAGVVFYGCRDGGGELLGVMGLQPVRDVALIRHAYVRTSAQRGGIGAALMDRIRAETTAPMLVGTWADATWAIAFYERNGFRLLPREETERLLREYWDIPASQVATSVVLAES